MKIKTFEDVKSWQKAKELFIELNINLKECKNYSYKDQLLRASLSIMNNIAEGFDRGSKKELRQFLIISRGSAAEVRSMLLVAQEACGMGEDTQAKNLLLAKDISRLLTGFIKSLDGQQITDNR